MLHNRTIVIVRVIRMIAVRRAINQRSEEKGDAIYNSFCRRGRARFSDQKISDRILEFYPNYPSSDVKFHRKIRFCTSDYEEI